eukprot:196008-Amphidinium_carterae.1
MAAVTQHWGRRAFCAPFSWRALRYAGPEANNDHSIVLAAVSQCWEALEDAGPQARNDHAILLLAVTQCWQALRFA